jgi:hypothetical protein
MFVPESSPVEYLKELSRDQKNPSYAGFAERKYYYYFSGEVPSGVVCQKQINVYCVACKSDTKRLVSQFTEAAGKIGKLANETILNLVIAYHPSSQDASLDNCVNEPDFLKMFPYMKKTIHFHNELVENIPQAFFRAVDDWVIKNAHAP